MAPSKTAAGRSKSKPKPKPENDGSPPKPFKRAPESLAPFSSTLSKKHVYIVHVDSKPRDFKRKIFVVPVLMNVGVFLLFLWRMNYILPYYWQLVESALLGGRNATTVDPGEAAWGELARIIVRRALTFMIDLVLTIFVWPWPVEFCLGRAAGSPVAWRWAVGFRDREVYVRRSRTWDRQLGDVLAEANAEGRGALLSFVRAATSPMLLQGKTGYLTMNGEWDLDWAAMVRATRLADDKTLALDALLTVVLFYHEQYGWLSVDTQIGDNAQKDERRRMVFLFRDALAAVGKEDLFFRWIEIVQFESSQPGGFGPEKRAEVAKKIRDLFQENGIDFDEFWKESVGSDPSAGI